MSALALLASYIPSFWYGTEIFVLCLTAILLTFLHDWLLYCYSNNHSISKWRSICSKKKSRRPGRGQFCQCTWHERTRKECQCTEYIHDLHIFKKIRRIFIPLIVSVSNHRIPVLEKEIAAHHPFLLPLPPFILIPSPNAKQWRTACC